MLQGSPSEEALSRNLFLIATAMLMDTVLMLVAVMMSVLFRHTCVLSCSTYYVNNVKTACHKLVTTCSVT